MSDSTETPQSAVPIAERLHRPLPVGYRQGIITAITVLLGFSLAFLRFWSVEAPGELMLRSVASTGTSAIAVVLQLVALFRSLRPEDDDEREYRKTVAWFLASAIVLLCGVLFAAIEAGLA